MKRIGITGGIGSGKTYVCSILEQKGYPVFYADIEAKHLMVMDEQLRGEVKFLFGDKAYFASGELNREHIATTIFSNESLRERLNSYVHPAVYRAFDVWAEKQSTDLVFIESALMIDTGNHEELDAIVLVVADKETRKKRVLMRDTMSEEEIENRMNVQSSDAFKKQHADYIIENSKGKDVAEQIEGILLQLQMAKR